jgi:glycosyl transferase family 25
MLPCYIINLDRAKERWETVSVRLQTLGFNVVRIPAIDGKSLVLPDTGFAPWRYFFFYGRPPAMNEIACYYSHIKALKTFLAADEPLAMICEDDIAPLPELPELLREALRYKNVWDLLRLNGIHATRGRRTAALPRCYRLCCDTKTASGAGCYVVNRRAAERIIRKLLPMCLPYDVALFYSSPFGVREVSVAPFPVVLNEKFYLNSTIGERRRYPLFSLASLRYPVQIPHKIISRSCRKISRTVWALRNVLFPPQPAD